MGAAVMWPTPRAMESPRSSAQGTAGPNLKEAAIGRDPLDPILWPTPKASEAFRGSDPPHGEGGSSLKQATVFHQPETTATGGKSGSQQVDLNPFFVASLMGLPWDWLTHCTSEVTDLCRKQQQRPSDSSSPEPDGN